MPEKSTKSEPKETAADAPVEATAAAPAPFKCPNDNCTKFHKAEFGEIVSGGVFVVKDATYRCVLCHTEYTTVQGEIVKA